MRMQPTRAGSEGGSCLHSRPRRGLDAHGKETKSSFRCVAGASEPSEVGRRSAITLDQDL